MPQIETITSITYLYLSEPFASLLNGILYGIELDKKTNLYHTIHITGLLHLVVLSGSNISLITGLLLSSLAHFSKGFAIVFTVLFIVFFITLTGLEAPIARAGILSICTLVCLLYGYRLQAWYILGLSGLIITIIKPEWLTSLSFQLTYAATGGIMLFGNMHIRNDEKAYGLGSISQYMRDELRVTLSAQVFTTPLIFYTFREISIISPLANICISWVVSPLIIAGFIMTALGLIHPLLGFVPSYICYGILMYMVMTIHLLAEVPYAFISFNPSG